MKRKLIICLLVMAISIAFMPVNAFAASESGKVKMTTYKIYKKGSIVYCVGDSGLYRVKVKNGVVKDKKRLVKATDCGRISGFKKKGNYLYYMHYTNGTPANLCRVKASGGKVQVLYHFTDAGDFAIKGKKIYFYGYNGDGNYVRKVMNLNGKNKKNTKLVAERKYKESNVKGYKVKEKVVKNKSGDQFEKTYLKTPKKTYYLGKSKKLLPW